MSFGSDTSRSSRRLCDQLVSEDQWSGENILIHYSSLPGRMGSSARAARPLATSTQPLITAFWEQRIARQREIDASIAAKADFEYLYDKPYDDKNVVRVAGPFTVESLSPHRVLGVDENDELIGRSEKSEVRSVKEASAVYHSSPFTLHHSGEADFASMILENLKTAGVQQAHKEDKITFTSLTPWPGDLICAEGDSWRIVNWEC